MSRISKTKKAAVLAAREAYKEQQEYIQACREVDRRNEKSSIEPWNYNPKCYNPDHVKITVIGGAYSNFR